MDTARYAELFLTESRENLVVVNEALLELERNPAVPEHLDSVFRAVHTIKGMAGVMGYAPVVDLAHETEALLACARDPSRLLKSDDIALLFQAADALEAAIEHAVCGKGPAPGVTALCERLRTAAGTPTPGPSSLTAGSKVPLPPGDGLTVLVRLTGDTPLKGARAFLIVQRARVLGEVVSIVPDESALLEERFGAEFSLRLRTDTAEDKVAAALRDVGYVERVTVRREGRRDHPRQPAQAADKAGGTAADAAWAAGGLKAPLQRYVRMDLHRLDALMNLIGELVIARGRLFQTTSRYADSEIDDAAAAVSRLVSELQDGIMSSRLVPVWQVFDRFPRVVRDAARTLDKQIDFVLDGREIELDRALLEQIGDPLIHLLRNAVDHGIEAPEARAAAGKPRTGRLVLSATRDRSAVVIRVTDNGRGIDRKGLLRRAQAEGAMDAEKADLSDEEVLRLIAEPGFSTAEHVTSLSGRGVGLDAVVTRVRGLGGSVELRSELGVGTTITLRLPVTLAILPALLARVDTETYALPLTHIRETLQLSGDVLRQVRGRDVLILRDEVLQLLNLRTMVALPPRDAEGSQVVVLEVADRRAGLVVDQLMGQQEVVVKPFDGVRGGAACFSGATILGDGAPALILEATSLF